jgi:type I restriction enzyme, S subunit
MGVWNIIERTEIVRRERMDAEYYQPDYLTKEQILQRLPCHTLGSLAFVTDGIHASPDVVEEGGVRYLSAKCVKENEFSLADTLEISHVQDSANLRTRLREGDLLLTTVGTIGNAAVVQPELLPSNIDRHLGLIRIRPDAPVDAYFTATFLNSSFGRFQSLREATGNVQLNLFIEKIKTLQIPALPGAKALSEKTRNAYDLRRKAMALIAEAENLIFSTVHLTTADLSTSLWYERDFEDLAAARRFGAEYFMPCKQRVLDTLAQKSRGPLSMYYTSARNLFDPNAAKRGDVVRNFDLTDALNPVLDDRLPPVPALEIGSTKKMFQTGDVVISRLRAYLREIALVRTTDSIPAVGSSEFIVLRRRGTEKHSLSQETLLIFLRSLPVQTILKWSQDGSQHPRFNEDGLLAIPIPVAVENISPQVDKLVNKALAAQAEASQGVAEATAEVEELVLKGAK